MRQTRRKLLKTWYAASRRPVSPRSPASASVSPVTDLRSAGDVVRRRNVVTILGLVAALAGPWPGAVPLALAQAPDTLAQLDGRWVRRLDIVTRTIFDPPPEQGRGVYVLANRLHVRTRPATVRGALVFREGSLWSESGRAESERHLRSLAFLVPDTLVASPVGTDSVDVRAVTHDNWTTSPEFGLESGGGQHFSSFSFIERNFLGLGTSLAVGYRDDVSGISRGASLEDDQLFGSHWRGRVAASRGSTGHGEAVLLLLPFWADEAPRSLGGDWQRDHVGTDLFSGGRLAARVGGRFERATLLWGAGRLANGSIRRLVFSLEKRDRSIGATVPYGNAPPVFASEPEELRIRRLAGEVRFLRPRYLVRQGVELMDRAEDIDIGRSFSLKGGFAPAFLGSSADEGFAQARLSWGHDAGRLGFGLLHAGVQSRFRRAPRELLGDVTARWVHQPRERWTAVAVVAGLAGRETPADFQLTLGGLSGLRAYSVHELTGTEAWRGNAELRWIGVRDWLRLVSLGVAGFYDAGRTWGAGSEGRGWHQDVGFGLRLSLPHSALNAVARFDVAWPIATASGGRSGPAYSFGSGQAF